jgi:phage terminase small subunit
MDHEFRLPTRRSRFAKEYCIDYNGTQAAIRAGYAANSAHVEASRLLKIAKVREAIQAEEERRAVQEMPVRDRVMRELINASTDSSIKPLQRIRALTVLGEILGLLPGKTRRQGLR